MGDMFNSHSDHLSKNMPRNELLKKKDLNRCGSYDLSSADEESDSNEVERELLKYDSGIKAFKGHVWRKDHNGEYLETVENTLTNMNTLDQYLLVHSKSY
jgi:hypothetical protein